MPDKIELKPVSEAQVVAAIEQRKAQPPEQPKQPVVEQKKPEPIVEQKKADPVVAEQKPAEKKEEKGTATVNKDGVVEEKKKSIKDISKPFSPKKKEAPTPADEIPEAFKSKFSEYEKQLAEREKRIQELEADFDLELIREAKKAGKTTFDLLKEWQGEDISKLSPNEKYERELKNSGVKYAKDLEEGSDEPSIEDEMEKFKALPKIARDREIELINKKHEESNANKATDFLGKIKEHNKAKESQTYAEQEKDRLAIEKTQKELNELADAYIGQEHYSVTGTPQLAESIKNFKLSDLVRTNEDGSLNAEDLFDLFHYKLTKDLRLENLENQFFAQGFDTYKEEVEVTGGARNNIVRAPQSTDYKTDREISNYTIANARPVRQ